MELEKMKRQYFFVTKDNLYLKKQLSNALVENEELQKEVRILTKMLKRFDRGRI